MSLDVYLCIDNPVVVESTGVFIRENGSNRELTIEEIPVYFPDADMSKFENSRYESDIVYKANITHNLNKMAEEVALYEVLWHPDGLFPEGHAIKAHEILPIMVKGFTDLLLQRERLIPFEAENNGWGTYDGLVTFVYNYIRACQEYPDATVVASP